MKCDQVQVSADGATVWIHGLDGSTLGRFSKFFGMDVHTSASDQLQGAAECLHCTHTKPSRDDWLLFCNLIQQHYGVQVAQDLVAF